MTDQTDPSASALAQPSGSVLSEAEIRARGIVLDAREGTNGGWRDCSYDLGAKYVIDSNGDVHELKPDDPFEIQPHGMVEVIASERLRLPDNVVAYAMVKTSLTVDGIFALNIGIVDPAYDGHISTTLINFGRKAYRLRSGDPFLRLTFHRLTASASPKKPEPKTLEQYLALRRKKATEHFSKTFLDMEGTAKAVSAELFGEWKKSFFVWLPLVAFAFALIALMFNATSIAINLWKRSPTEAEVRNICEDVARSLAKREPTLAPTQVGPTLSSPVATSSMPSSLARVTGTPGVGGAPNGPPIPAPAPHQPASTAPPATAPAKPVVTAPSTAASP